MIGDPLTDVLEGVVEDVKILKTGVFGTRHAVLK